MSREKKIRIENIDFIAMKYIAECKEEVHIYNIEDEDFKDDDDRSISYMFTITPFRHKTFSCKENDCIINITDSRKVNLYFRGY